MQALTLQQERFSQCAITKPNSGLYKTDVAHILLMGNRLLPWSVSLRQKNVPLGWPLISQRLRVSLEEFPQRQASPIIQATCSNAFFMRAFSFTPTVS